MKKGNKGITLIALIISIIVMLILVGVTITISINGGLFGYAKNAAEKTNTAITDEGKLSELIANLIENGGIDEENQHPKLTVKYLNGANNLASFPDIDDEVYEVESGEQVTIKSKEISGYHVNILRIQTTETQDLSVPEGVPVQMTIPVNRDITISFIYAQGSEQETEDSVSDNTEQSEQGGSQGQSGANPGSGNSGSSGSSSGPSTGGGVSRPTISGSTSQGAPVLVMSSPVSSSLAATYKQELNDTDNEYVFEDIEGIGSSTSGDITIVLDVSKIAKTNDVIEVKHRKGNNNWEVLGQFTTDSNKKITFNVSSFSPFAFKNITEANKGYTVTVYVDNTSDVDSNRTNFKLYFANGTTMDVDGWDLYYTDGNGHWYYDTEVTFNNVKKIQVTDGYLAIVENGINKGIENETYTLTADIEVTRYMTQECISYDTLVTMADGTLKKLGEIEVGDMVLSVDFDTMQLVPRKVIFSGRDEPDYDEWYVDCYYKNVYSDGTVIDQAMHHRFYNLESQSFVYLHNWNIGEHTYNLKGENPTLVSRELIQGRLYYARITLEDCNCYFANGLLTGDRRCPSGYSLTIPLN